MNSTGSIKQNKISLFFSIAFIILVMSCSNSNNKHIGEWIATDNFSKLGIILDKDNNAVLYFANEVIGGDNFKINGVKTEVKYEIDYTKNPIWLDIVIYDTGENRKERRIKGIVRFISDNKMQYRMNFNQYANRDESFEIDNGEESFILNRVFEH
jgi:hypothetical protein